jgi:hypothetical protein
MSKFKFSSLVFSEAQDSCRIELTPYVPDTCIGSSFPIGFILSVAHRVCATNLPSSIAVSGTPCVQPDMPGCDSIMATAFLFTPPCVQNPMTNYSIQSVYLSLDTIPGMNTFACGHDVRLWLRSPAGTFLQLATDAPQNLHNNKYKPTFTYTGMDGIMPDSDSVSYNLLAYLPFGGLLTFTGENPYASGGRWMLYLNDIDSATGCSDSIRITEFCIDFGIYPVVTSTWASDSICLSYLSNIIWSNATFNRPPGEVNCDYTVTVNSNSCGCTDTAVTNVHVYCPGPSSVNSITHLFDNSLSVFYSSDKQTAFINAKELKGKKVEVEVYDEMGRSLTPALSKGEGVGGYFTMDLDCKDFAAGVYIVVVQTEYEKLVKRFVKN